jgi:hypothetical protein
VRKVAGTTSPRRKHLVQALAIQQFASNHYSVNPPCVPNINEGVRVEDNKIGDLSAFDRAMSELEIEIAGRVRCRGSKGFRGRESRIHP